MTEIERALKSFEDGNYSTAVAIYKNILQIAPKSLRGQDLRRFAFCLIEASQYDNALNVLIEWEGNEGETAISLSMKSYCYEKINNLEDSILALRKSLALKSRASGYCVLGDTLKKSGKYADAQKAYAEALMIDPTYVEALHSISLLKGLV